MDGVLKERLRDPEQRQYVVDTVMAGFAELRKKPVPDLEARVQKIEERVRQMVQEIELRFVNGRLVVKAVGSSETLMTELRRGSNWYEPWDRVDEVVFAAVLVDPSK